MNFHRDVARCVGLWLAEGDKKTLGEITFTNNCVSLVKFFEETIKNIFPEEGAEPRVYVYSPRAEKFEVPFSSKVNWYVDDRARKPYHIYKISGRSLVKRWKELVGKYIQTRGMYKYILQGFFAGEGNIKFHRASCSRTVRIAQGKRNKFLETVLEHISIKNRFSSVERAYVITGRRNLSKLAEMNVAILHPEKRKKFREMMDTYKQYHYPPHYFKRRIYELLKKPRSSHELSNLLSRSRAYTQETLKTLKDEGKVQNFRIERNSLWVRTDQNIILISEIKQEYLKLLNEYGSSTTAFLAREREVSFKAAFRRLKELEKLGLIKRNPNKEWELCPTNRRVITINPKELRA